jgi:hypothetical protein
VAAHARHRLKDVLADFRGDLLKVVGPEPAQVGRRVDRL